MGGMAEVFRAKAFGVAGFERLVAVKRILPNIAEDREFIKMFIDEAKIAVQLNHANIAQVFDLGRVEGAYYIALEHVFGRDLRALYDRARELGETIPVAQACFAVMKMCEGLDYAHKRRGTDGAPLDLVHRDISPQNILVSFDGEVKVIDFGIAKASGKATKTQAGILKGKFAYMSPEQVRGLPLDRRSDIFSMAIVLYELLTGQRLFAGESDFSTLEAVRAADIGSPSDSHPQIPRALSKVLLKALARDPNDRYQHAIEFHNALEEFVRDSGSFCSRQDMAAWMRSRFADEISEEKQKLEEFRSIKAPDGMERTFGVSTSAEFESDDVHRSRNASTAALRAPRKSRTETVSMMHDRSMFDGETEYTYGPSSLGEETDYTEFPSAGYSTSPHTRYTEYESGFTQGTEGFHTEFDSEMESRYEPVPPRQQTLDTVGIDSYGEELPSASHETPAVRPKPVYAGGPETLHKPVAPVPTAPSAADSALNLSVSQRNEVYNALAAIGLDDTAKPNGKELTPMPSLEERNAGSEAEFPFAMDTPPYPQIPTERRNTRENSNGILPSQSRPSTLMAEERQFPPSTRMQSPVVIGFHEPAPRPRSGILLVLFTMLIAGLGVGAYFFMRARGVDGLAAFKPSPTVETTTKPKRHAKAKKPKKLKRTTAAVRPAVMRDAPFAGFRLEIDEDSAEVWLDGKALGNRGSFEVRRLTPGKHQLKIVGPRGYADKELELRLRAGETEKIKISLDPLETAVTFSSEPPGATVTLIQGKKRTEVGVTPAVVVINPERSYRAEFKKSGYRKKVEKVQVKGERGKVSVTLSEKRRDVEEVERDEQVGEGTLRLGSKPPCRIFIDGRDTGKSTPQRNLKLMSGSHKITLKNADHGIDETFRVEIRDGETTRSVRDLTDRMDD